MEMDQPEGQKGNSVLEDERDVPGEQEHLQSCSPHDVSALMRLAQLACDSEASLSGNAEDSSVLRCDIQELRQDSPPTAVLEDGNATSTEHGLGLPNKVINETGGSGASAGDSLKVTEEKDHIIGTAVESKISDAIGFRAFSTDDAGLCQLHDGEEHSSDSSASKCAADKDDHSGRSRWSDEKIKMVSNVGACVPSGGNSVVKEDSNLSFRNSAAVEATGNNAAVEATGNNAAVEATSDTQACLSNQECGDAVTEQADPPLMITPDAEGLHQGNDDSLLSEGLLSDKTDAEQTEPSMMRTPDTEDLHKGKDDSQLPQGMISDNSVTRQTESSLMMITGTEDLCCQEKADSLLSEGLNGDRSVTKQTKHSLIITSDTDALCQGKDDSQLPEGLIGDKTDAEQTEPFLTITPDTEDLHKGKDDSPLPEGLIGDKTGTELAEPSLMVTPDTEDLHKLHKGKDDSQLPQGMISDNSVTRQTESSLMMITGTEDLCCQEKADSLLSEGLNGDRSVTKQTKHSLIITSDTEALCQGKDDSQLPEGLIGDKIDAEQTEPLLTITPATEDLHKGKDDSPLPEGLIGDKTDAEQTEPLLTVTPDTADLHKGRDDSQLPEDMIGDRSVTKQTESSLMMITGTEDLCCKEKEDSPLSDCLIGDRSVTKRTEHSLITTSDTEALCQRKDVSPLSEGLTGDRSVTKRTEHSLIIASDTKALCQGKDDSPLPEGLIGDKTGTEQTEPSLMMTPDTEDLHKGNYVRPLSEGMIGDMSVTEQAKPSLMITSGTEDLCQGEEGSPLSEGLIGDKSVTEQAELSLIIPHTEDVHQGMYDNMVSESIGDKSDTYRELPSESELNSDAAPQDQITSHSEHDLDNDPVSTEEEGLAGNGVTHQPGDVRFKDGIASGADILPEFVTSSVNEHAALEPDSILNVTATKEEPQAIHIPFSNVTPEADMGGKSEVDEGVSLNVLGEAVPGHADVIYEAEKNGYPKLGNEKSDFLVKNTYKKGFTVTLNMDDANKDAKTDCLQTSLQSPVEMRESTVIVPDSAPHFDKDEEHVSAGNTCTQTELSNVAESEMIISNKSSLSGCDTASEKKCLGLSIRQAQLPVVCSLDEKRNVCFISKDSVASCSAINVNKDATMNTNLAANSVSTPSNDFLPEVCQPSEIGEASGNHIGAGDTLDSRESSLETCSQGVGVDITDLNITGVADCGKPLAGCPGSKTVMHHDSAEQRHHGSSFLETLLCETSTTFGTAVAQEDGHLSRDSTLGGQSSLLGCPAIQDDSCVVVSHPSVKHPVQINEDYITPYADVSSKVNVSSEELSECVTDDTKIEAGHDDIQLCTTDTRVEGSVGIKRTLVNSTIDVPNKKLKTSTEPAASLNNEQSLKTKTQETATTRAKRQIMDDELHTDAKKVKGEISCVQYETDLNERQQLKLNGTGIGVQQATLPLETCSESNDAAMFLRSDEDCESDDGTYNRKPSLGKPLYSESEKDRKEHSAMAAHVCSKCEMVWSGDILRKLFEGTERVVVNSKVTYGAFICMTRYAYGCLGDGAEGALKALLDRADLIDTSTLSSMRMLILANWCARLMTEKKVKCCDVFKSLYTSKIIKHMQEKKEAKMTGQSSISVTSPCSSNHQKSVINMTTGKDVKGQNSRTKTSLVSGEASSTLPVSCTMDKTVQKIPSVQVQTVISLPGLERCVTVGDVLNKTSRGPVSLLPLRIEVESLSPDVCLLYEKMAYDEQIMTDDETHLSIAHLPSYLELFSLYNASIQSKGAGKEDQFYKALFQILLNRNYVLLVPDPYHLVKLVTLLAKNKVHKVSEHHLHSAFDENFMYVTQLCPYKIAGFPTVGQVLSLFCLWKNVKLCGRKHNSNFILSKRMKHMIPTLKVEDYVGTCVRLFGMYWKFAFEKKDVLKAKTFLQLTYTGMLENLDEDTVIVNQDLNFVPRDLNHTSFVRFLARDIQNSQKEIKAKLLPQSAAKLRKREINTYKGKLLGTVLQSKIKDLLMDLGKRKAQIFKNSFLLKKSSSTSEMQELWSNVNKEELEKVVRILDEHKIPHSKRLSHIRAIYDRVLKKPPPTIDQINLLLDGIPSSRQVFA